MYYVYILRNVIKNQIYPGSTKDLRKRLKEHNEGKEVSTRRYLPWNLIYYEAFTEENMARIREQKLKHNGNSMKELKKRIGLTKNGAGFTLIEILIVMVAILVISGASYIAFIKFNNYQKLNASYEDLRNTLSEARASALSQSINSCLNTYTLVGHRVDIVASGYTLYEVCQLGVNTPITYVKKSKTIPSGITLIANPSSFLFLVLTGEFSNSVSPGSPGTIQLTNGTDTKTITVHPIGRIE